jgi:transcriptional regulator with XRE-family HTH domain
MKEVDFSNLLTWLPRQIKRIGLRKEQFAHRVGVSRTTIYRYIYDMDRPTEDTMLKMCRVLEIPLEEGLRQYTPKRNGRPIGGGGSFAKVRTR